MLYEKHETRIRALLEHLSAKGAQRHKELMRVWMEHNGTLGSFNNVVRWLKHKNYIKKSEKDDNLSPYEITDAGRKYLEGLRA
jgi:predicted transcriptional regulator